MKLPDAPVINKEHTLSLPRVLNVRSLVLFGLSYLAPIGIFAQFGPMTVLTHGMATLSYVVSMVIMLFTALSYKKLAAVYPVAGSAYSYVQRSVNPYLGFMTGWIMLLDYLLLPMICCLYLGLYLNKYCPFVPVWLWIIISVAIISIINILGIKPTVMVNTWSVLIQAVFSLLFLFITANLIADGGGAGTFFSLEAVYNAPEFDSDAFLMSVGTLTIAFLGFDAVTALAEETRQAEQTVGRALVLVCLLAGGCFTVVSYFCQIAWPSGWQEILDPSTGFFEVSEKLQSAYISPLYFWAANLASLTCAISGQSVIVRLLYSMGRDEVLPKRYFAYVSPRFKTPVYTIVFVAFISLTAIAFADKLLEAMALISFGALAGFAMVNVAVFFRFYLRKKRHSPMDTVEYLILPLIGAVLCLYLLFHLPQEAKILGSIWLGLGVFYTAVTTNFFRKLPPDLALE